MFEQKKIAFIGGGKISESILHGLMLSGNIEAKQFFVTDTDEARLRLLAEQCGVNTVQNDSSNHAACKLASECDLLILAVKPQMADVVLPSLAKGIRKNCLVISLIGGVTLANLASLFEQNPVFRVMPNTPMRVRKGVAGIVAGAHTDDESLSMVTNLFSLVGASYVIPEKWMDSLTAISGCGPAFAYMFTEALADGGVQLGLPRDLALALASQTLVGAGEMQRQTGLHPGVLKDNVTSPGGGTIAGVHALESGAFRGTVMQAVLASGHRMGNLAKD